MTEFSLEACRRNAGFSLKDASKQLGVSDKTLSKYEHDSSKIPLNLLKEMCNLYQVKPDCIFLGQKYELIRKIREKRK